MQKSLENDIAAKLHVLTLTPFYPSAGDEVSGCFVAEAVRQIEAEGVDSSVIAVDSIYHARRHPHVKYPAEWVRYPQWPGTLGLSGAGRLLGAALLPRVRRLHRQTPVSLIHAHAALPCGDAAGFLSRRLGIPYVVTVHGLDVFNRCFQDGWGAKWRRESSVRTYEGARKVICISDKVRQNLAGCAAAAARAEIVYNGTDPDFFQPPPATDAQSQPPTALIVGNLLAGKGHELVLRAMERLKASHPDLRCTVIGEGADRRLFMALAERLAISERVDFLGRRSRLEVAEAMRRCTVFVLPSRYEGLGCVYLEAMASGKAAIGCREQGIDEIIRHGGNGWLIPVDGLEQLVQALKTLLDDPALRRQIGGCARQTILQGFTLAHQARKVADIYRESAS
jgi:glycosyltransferase involved in cell wall biosynthesis